MFKVTSESGSVYEIDRERKLIRRLSGSHAPTERQGADGEWKKYADMEGLSLGDRLLIIWNVANEIRQCTQTSGIVKIEENANAG